MNINKAFFLVRMKNANCYWTPTPTKKFLRAVTPACITRYNRGVVADCRELELKDGVPVIRGVVEESLQESQITITNTEMPAKAGNIQFS